MTLENMTWGPVVNIMDLPEPAARAILGDAVYEVLRGWHPAPGYLRVIAVDRENRSITVTYE